MMFPTRLSNRRPASRALADGRLPLAIALALACTSGAALAAPQDAAGAATATATDLDAVLVVAQRAERVSNGATNLDLAIKDTPQSISVVSAEQMRQFGATSVNDALRLATGVQVDEWETNRTTYSARGFDILNTQLDGVGLPNGWGVSTGAFDTFGYEKVEVIRGANGLLTGVGNAAGTINYVRKRPTNEAQGSLGLSYGSWGTVRAEVDYSTPFTDDGRWAGRVVAAHEDGESWLRANENSRHYLYGVVDGQIGENGTLTLGYSYQRAKSDGIMWGALTFMDSDGTQNAWPTSASTTQDWTYWDTTNQTAFAEYAHQLGQDWQLKVSYNYRRATGDENMFYAFLRDTDEDGTAEALDPATGLGLYGYPWGGKDEATMHLGAVTLNGHFELFGRDQEAMLGLSVARSESDSWERSADFSSPAWGALPPFPYAANAIPEPAWSELSLYSVLNQRLKRAFGATRIALSERLKAIVGVNYAEYRRNGNSYALAFDQTTRHTSPYGGLTFDFSDQVLGYVSYSDIYQPQDQVDANDRYLDASKGVNYEAGIKAQWLDQRLLTTLAVFKADQQGLATPTGEYNEFGSTIYAPVDVRSKGVELEAVGRLNDHLDLVFGYTALKLDGLNGDDTYSWVPRRTANLLLSGRLPGYEAISWGVGGRWQSDIFNVEASGFPVRQGSYLVGNAFAAWDFLPNATLQVNVNNLGDEKYINTLRYSGYYGAPRNYSLSLSWRF
ncbi:TonB-dependent siderophore receptor [Pseudoxanthomonas sp.]|uniref:TonB-dependent siderophore receptor n=1 Tax=Pseudoxanthomonas sp. TaxID=1871049 RepID=UPI00258D5F60|nr:TonB-dependent siderophore receptor [Pseudoxanthomonas sp.]MCR6684911.1 TonB-dependent siderophore receptor [Pseudoxanthomonas sp.]